MVRSNSNGSSSSSVSRVWIILIVVCATPLGLLVFHSLHIVNGKRGPQLPFASSALSASLEDFATLPTSMTSSSSSAMDQLSSEFDSHKYSYDAAVLEEEEEEEEVGQNDAEPPMIHAAAALPERRGTLQLFPALQAPRHGGASAENSCDRLYGTNHIVLNEDDCIQHDSLHWTGCRLKGGLKVDTLHIIGSDGNETVHTVKGRTEEEELLIYEKGALTVLGKSAFPMMDKLWSRVRKGVVTSPEKSVDGRQDDIPTLLMNRPTYANPCFWTAAVYNLFVTMATFKIQTKPRIVFMDGHAWTAFNSVWGYLFQAHEVVHIKSLRTDTTYTNVILVPTLSTFHDPGLREHRRKDACQTDSSLHQFRDFVLNRYGLVHKPPPTKGEKKKVTFLIRSDYMAHPRSDGITDRKLHDLEEAKATVESEYPNDEVTVVGFEEMSYSKQLRVITQTDVLVAVHGAGNVHSIFLPPHATLVEYFPPAFGGRIRFRYLAECMGIRHISRSAQIKGRLSKNRITVKLQK